MDGIKRLYYQLRSLIKKYLGERNQRWIYKERGGVSMEDEKTILFTGIEPKTPYDSLSEQEKIAGLSELREHGLERLAELDKIQAAPMRKFEE